MKSNLKEDICSLPFGVDDMSNAANDAYAAWPERLYIVDESARIAYRGGMGPFNYNPKEVRAWLAARYGEVKHPEQNKDQKPPDKPAEKPADKPDSPTSETPLKS